MYHLLSFILGFIFAIVMIWFLGTLIERREKEKRATNEEEDFLRCLIVDVVTFKEENSADIILAAIYNSGLKIQKAMSTKKRSESCFTLYLCYRTGGGADEVEESACIIAKKVNDILPSGAHVTKYKLYSKEEK